MLDSMKLTQTASIDEIIGATQKFLPKPGQRVVVAMSGGVDSSVVAALAHHHGCETIGITMRLSDSDAAPKRVGSCCAGSDIADARTIADTRGFAHYVLDYVDRFRTEVMESFADTYLAGHTPNPCISCNQTVKFRDLLQVADDLGAEALLTGHYVRRLDGPGGPELHRAVDTAKDQSYFLFATNRAQLARLRFPLGGLDKPSVRALAEYFELPVANKPDSQDICFVPDGDYRSVVRNLRPGADRPGDIVHVSGEKLGRHEGLIGFTIGQRRGIDVGGQTEPLYVVRIDTEANQLVVGPKQALGVDRIDLTRLNWLAGPIPNEGLPVEVKVRSMAPPTAARIFDTDTPHVLLDQLQYGVAPGQAAVCYQGSRVLGGGFIQSTHQIEPEDA